MTETNKNEGEVSKRVVEKSLADMRIKGMELKTKVENWAQNNSIKDDMDELLMEKNPIKKAARAIAAE